MLNNFQLVAQAGRKEVEHPHPAAKKIDFMAGISSGMPPLCQQPDPKVLKNYNSSYRIAPLNDRPQESPGHSPSTGPLLAAALPGSKASGTLSWPPTPRTYKSRSLRSGWSRIWLIHGFAQPIGVHAPTTSSCLAQTHRPGARAVGHDQSDFPDAGLP